MKRHATAIWKGPGNNGRGSLTTQSAALKQTPYSFNSRFADAEGANPEELLAAAHAGCFTMKLSFTLGEAGFIPEVLETHSYVTLENGFITESHLAVKAKVPKIDKETFNACVKDAEVNCPLSKVLKAKITVEASLLN